MQAVACRYTASSLSLVLIRCFQCPSGDRKYRDIIAYVRASPDTFFSKSLPSCFLGRINKCNRETGGEKKIQERENKRRKKQWKT